MIPLDRYRPRQQLRSDPTCRTVRAEAPDRPDTVVVKLLTPPWLSRPADRQAAWETIQGWTQLRHPAVAAPGDVGWSRDGLVLITPFFAAGSLEDRLRQGALDSLDLRQFAAEASQALHDAHGHGLVHANLKPSNLVFDEDGHLHLIDFRLGAGSGSAPSTAGDEPPGSDYAAPEVSAAAPATPAADQYSLALILLTILLRESVTQALEWLRVGNAQAASTSARQAREASPLPARVGPVLRRALSTRPEDRYRSVDVFHRHFEYSMGFTSQPGPAEVMPSTVARPVLPTRQPRRLGALAAAAALALFLAVTVPMLSSAARHDLLEGGLLGATSSEELQSASQGSTDPLLDGSGAQAADLGSEESTGDPGTSTPAEDSGNTEGGGATELAATQPGGASEASSEEPSPEPSATPSVDQPTATPTEPSSPTPTPTATPSAPVPNPSSCKADPSHPRYCTPTPGP